MKQKRAIISIIAGVIILGFGAVFQSCDEVNNNLPTITVSRDTILFDTIFTSMGSHTEIFLIRNNSNETVNLDRVYIPNGNASNFRFNVNAYSGPSVEDLELDGGDSMYVFVEVTVDPNGGTTPLIVEDSLVVEYNGGNSTKAMLVAFGQDAIYYYPTDTTSYGLPYSTLPCGDVTWGPEKPIVVVGYLQDTCGTLTVLPGTQVHFYRNGALFIDDGANIHVLGDKHNPAVFQGTRLGHAYQDVPGQWDRIYVFEGNTDNIIRNAIIKNSFIGLQLDDGEALNETTPVFTAPSHMVLENVQIKNCSAIGLFTRHYNVEGYNVMVTNCGQYCAAFTYGGKVDFYQSTFANYWTGSIRNFPAVFISDYYVGQSVILQDSMDFSLYNGIIYGNGINEMAFDSATATPLQIKFVNSVLKLDQDVDISYTARYINVLKNAEPEFTDTYNGDFTLADGSSAVNLGDPNIVTANASQLMFDLKGTNRLTSGNPDAGVYEK